MAAYRRRYVRDRWWLAAGVIVAVGCVLVSAVSSADWILVILGVAVLVYGVRLGGSRAE
jgi:predicted cobalt transporter CbtA